MGIVHTHTQKNKTKNNCNEQYNNILILFSPINYLTPYITSYLSETKHPAPKQ